MPAVTTTTRDNAASLSAGTAASGGLATSGGGDGGVGPPLLIAILGLPALMLLVSMLPSHTVALAGPVGRVAIRGRVVLAALALAIWLGVFVSLLLGGQA